MRKWSVYTGRDGLAVLAERVDHLRSAATNETGDDELTRLIQAARITVEWEDKRGWLDRRHGCGLVVPSASGFVVRLPAANSRRWQRFVLGHELGHSCFFNPADIVGSTADVRLHAGQFRPRKDVWFASATIEEYLCDRIADTVLVPHDVVHIAHAAGGTRLNQVEHIADACVVPVDRAFMRRASVLGDVGEADSHSCAEVVVWRVSGRTVLPVYHRGCGRLRPRPYGMRNAGIDWFVQSCEQSALRRNVQVSLPGMCGRFHVELVQLERSACLLSAYDHADGRAGGLSYQLTPRDGLMDDELSPLF